MIRRGQIWSIGGQGWRVLGHRGVGTDGTEHVVLKSVKNRDMYRLVPYADAG
jgi:hypothetical protein